MRPEKGCIGLAVAPEVKLFSNSNLLERQDEDLRALRQRFRPRALVDNQDLNTVEFVRQQRFDQCSLARVIGDDRQPGFSHQRVAHEPAAVFGWRAADARASQRASHPITSVAGIGFAMTYP